MIQVVYIGAVPIEEPNSKCIDVLEKLTLNLLADADEICDRVFEIIFPPLETITDCNSMSIVLKSINGIYNDQIFRLDDLLLFYQCKFDLACFILVYREDLNMQENGCIYTCHVLRCANEESINLMMLSLETLSNLKSFRAMEQQTIENGDNNTKPENIDAEFITYLEIKESDKDGFAFAPQEKSCFKLRRGRTKVVHITLQHIKGPNTLLIHKCFGVLIAPGRNVKQCDMNLLDMVSSRRSSDNKTYLIDAAWDPNIPQFDVLNSETPKDTRVYMTIAVDVLLEGVHEPVRLRLECKARIYHEHERFWRVARHPVSDRFYITLRRRETPPNSSAPFIGQSEDTAPFEVIRCESQIERDWRESKLYTQRSPSKMPANLLVMPDDDDTDSDEPLLSGSGSAVVGKGKAETIEAWEQCLKDLEQSEDTNQRSKEIASLILQSGVPDSLRKRVWPILAGCPKDEKLIETYNMLLSKECPSEAVIMRDIHRTFPAHDFFKDVGGVGQQVLYKISKAYSLYDEEVGYCQGLSFVAATLLLQLDEEQAFCVLVKVMVDYGLRDLFKQGFESLHLRLHQLERLIEDYIPDLHQHFLKLNIETHMYASQWFLTLFTAKFTLSLVFRIMDLLLSEGMDAIFNISISLLKACKRHLMDLDFEGVLKYFRVVLPRKYRTENEAEELLQQATELKISRKRLSKYEKEYIAMRNKETESLDPVQLLKHECQKMRESVLRLERENDDLAHELVTGKIQLRRNLDAAEDNIDALQNQMAKMSENHRELEDNSKRMIQEAEKVKDLCRCEIDKLDAENGRLNSIIQNYKQICTDLGYELESRKANYEDRLLKIQNVIRTCPSCSCKVDLDSFLDLSPTRSDNSDPLMATTSGDENDNALLNGGGGSGSRQLELELARTKLALVESECRSQDLMHQLASGSGGNGSGSPTPGVAALGAGKWLRRTLSTLKDATRNAQPAYPPPTQSLSYLQ